MRQNTCFVTSTAPLSTTSTSSTTFLPRTSLHTVCQRPARAHISSQRRSHISMGLFGLGMPELLVIAGVGIFIFGPSKIAEMGKDLGGVAGGVKKATADFREAMEESLAEADKEIEAKKAQKESASGKTVDAAVKPVDEGTASGNS